MLAEGHKGQTAREDRLQRVKGMRGRADSLGWKSGETGGDSRMICKVYRLKESGQTGGDSG